MNTHANPRDLPLGYVRTVLTLLVVAHHALLAYHPYAPEPAKSLLAEPRLWMAFPIVDSARWSGVETFIGFNDVFFMSLMFLVSGVFAWTSLQRRGTGAFLRERLLRIGVPFVVAAGVLAPLAYYPTWLATGASTSSFWAEWRALGAWPAGPAWFLWVLLVFGVLAAMLHRFLPRVVAAGGRRAEVLGRHPLLLLLTLLLIGCCAYVPLSLQIDPSHWSHHGPFYVQTSRTFHYATYFLVGLGLGAAGLGRGLFDPAGRLARRWPLWLVAALLGFMYAVAMFIAVMGSYAQGGPGPILSLLGSFGFVLSCACTSLFCIAVAVRLARKGHPLLDSLSRNAYGIFLLHYACVSWLQWSLLGAGLPGWVKGSLVVLGATLASWGLTAALRKIPGVARVL